MDAIPVVHAEAKRFALPGVNVDDDAIPVVHAEAKRSGSTTYKAHP